MHKKYRKFVQSSNKFAYLLVIVNIIIGSFILFALPKFLDATSYSEALIQLFALQFASLFEAGAIIFFINLTSGNTITEHLAHSLIALVNKFQIGTGTFTVLIYAYFYVNEHIVITTLLISMHIIFSLLAVPRLFSISYTYGYEEVQKYKFYQNLIALSLIAVQLFFKSIHIMLPVSYSISSLIIYAIICHRYQPIKSTSNCTITEAIKYCIKILSTSLTWLFINFIMAGALQTPSSNTAAQSWVMFRTADTLLGARFNNKITHYVQHLRSNTYLRSFTGTVKQEALLTIMVAAFAGLVTNLMFGTNYSSQLFIWLILQRSCSIYNIHILPDYTWKNFFNTLILVLTGAIYLTLRPGYDPINTILTMWITLFLSNLLYKKAYTVD